MLARLQTFERWCVFIVNQQHWGIFTLLEIKVQKLWLGRYLFKRCTFVPIRFKYVPLRYQNGPFRYKHVPFEKVPPQWKLLYLYFWDWCFSKILNNLTILPQILTFGAVEKAWRITGITANKSNALTINEPVIITKLWSECVIHMKNWWFTRSTSLVEPVVYTRCLDVKMNVIIRMQYIYI